MSNRNHLQSRRNETRWVVWSAILLAILIVICAISFVVVQKSITAGVSQAKDAFSTSYDDMKDNAYDRFYDTAYHLSEAANHVSNDVSISISAVKERTALEVLKVNDVVYVINDSEDNKEGTTSWLKVSGSGVFTVNMSEGEFLVDSSRHYVLIRIPQPVLLSENIRIDSFDSLYFRENTWNLRNSAKSGEALARNQLNEAKMRIQEDFEENEKYSKLASSSAEIMIISLVKGLNSEVTGLTVEVEFY